MLDPNDPNDPLWREDVSAQKDDIEAIWKTQYGFVMKLEYQNAPPELVKKMVAVNNLLHQAHEVMDEIIPYFPEEPRKP